MLRIMLVEDESTIRQGLKQVIEKVIGGFEVTWEAPNGQRAIELLHINIPDLLITDIRMPVMNGLDLIQQVKHIYPHLPTLIISGHEDFQYARLAMRYGVMDYILKPINRVELTEILTKVKDHLQKQQSKESPLHQENSRQVEQIKNVIMNHISEDITLAKVGQIVNLHPNYISQLFKKETGYRIMDYVTQLRISKAKQLLSETNLKIIDIAHLVGYQSDKHFMQVFKKITKYSPSQFRNIKN